MAGIESLLVGRVLGGRYRIEEVIGRGGMGAVYRAVDERLGREVALKVITLTGTGEAEARERLRARFFREARSAAALPHHPNVVPVYDYGSDEALGLDYIVMELLRGSDLASRLSRSGAVPLSMGIKILIEAARGVAVGHRQGLIHRDVKPGNIFLTEAHGGEVQVRVVDFGIAKLADDEDTLAQLTQDGRVPHSPAYASPEQLRGLSELTPASDVFSLGAVGFQLLAGDRAFSETDRNRMSLGMAVPPPSLRARNPAVSSAIEGVIRKALAFEAGERHPDAGAMAAELAAAVTSIADATIEPYRVPVPLVTHPEEDYPGADATILAELEDERTLLAPPPAPTAQPPNTGGPQAGPGLPPPLARGGRPESPRPRVTRERPARAGVGGILVWTLVLGLVAAAGIWGWSEMQRSPDIALELPPPPDSIPMIEPDILGEPIGPTLLDAVLSNQEGLRHFRLGQYDSALAHFQRAVQIAPENPDYRLGRANTLLRLGRAQEAADELDRTIPLDPGRSTPYFNLAEARLALRDTTAAIAALEQYIQREGATGNRQIAETRLSELRRAQEADLPPLLGEPVTDGQQPSVDGPPGG